MGDDRDGRWGWKGRSGRRRRRGEYSSVQDFNRWISTGWLLPKDWLIEVWTFDIYETRLIMRKRKKNPEIVWLVSFCLSRNRGHGWPAGIYSYGGDLVNWTDLAGLRPCRFSLSTKATETRSILLEEPTNVPQVLVQGSGWTIRIHTRSSQTSGR